jgi:hypothetical protein
VVTLVALQRAGAWSTAAVAAERANLMDTSLDRTSSCLGGVTRAGLCDKKQDPARRARAFVWRLNDKGADVITSHGTQALSEVNATTRDLCNGDIDSARIAS